MKKRVTALAAALLVLCGGWSFSGGVSVAGASAAYDSVGLIAGEGLRFAGKGDLTGMIDDEGELVIPALYNGLSPFVNGYVCGYIDEIKGDGSGTVVSRVFDGEGKVLLEKEGVFAEYYDGEHSILSRVEKTTSALGQDNVRLYRYALGDGKLNAVTSWDEYDSLKSPALYRSISDVVMAGKAAADDDTLRLRQHYGFVSLKGEVVVPLVYDEIRWQEEREDAARIVCRITEEYMDIAGQMGWAHSRICSTASGSRLRTGLGKATTTCEIIRT